MTSRAIGGVFNRIPQVASYTLPATLIQNITSVSESVPPPSPAPTPPVYITVGNISSVPDNSGMVSFKNKILFSQSQNEAIRSAAQNTAVAFGLDVVLSGDKAVLKNNQSYLEDLNAIQIPNRSIDEILIPS
jgi:hypothetical protein